MKHLLLIVCLFFLFSCTSKKGDPMPIVTTASNCPSFDSISYFQQVAPIMSNHCNSCHQPGTGGPFTNTYSNLKLISDSGQLVGVITSNSAYSAMPISGPLDSCSIKIIKQWILEGAKNN